MKKADRDKLSNAMSSLLSLKEIASANEKQQDALKEIITSICKVNLGEFDKDGILAVEGIGNVKIVANAPGLKLMSTGKTLNSTEQAGLVTILGAKYGKLTVDVAQVRDEVAKGNQSVIKALAKHKVELVQVDRYDVKKL